MSRPTLSTDQVLAMSPDASSTKAAQGLVVPAKWPALGASDEAVWGECQGSGSKPYQTQVHFVAGVPSFKCSCPSRKFPCKHGLALLLFLARDSSAFTAVEPGWVTEWLSSRRDRAEKKEIKAAEAASAAPPDPAVVLKRQAQRLQRMCAGARELALWLDDLMRQGLATLSSEQEQNWQAMAARMVDAQAARLGQLLTNAMTLVGQGRDWPARLLQRLGSLQLLLDALQRYEQLPASMQAHVRQALGWSYDRDEVLVAGERVTDQWRVLANVVTELENRLTEHRVWLQGTHTQRRALLLDYAHATRPVEMGWAVGQLVGAELAFYPGDQALRALAVGAVTPAGTDDAAEGAADVALAQAFAATCCRDEGQEWMAMAKQCLANPWLMQSPVCFRDVRLMHHEPQNTEAGLGSAAVPEWTLHLSADPGGQVRPSVDLRIVDAHAWQMMALSGGEAFNVFGEWNGERLTPLLAWNAAEYWAATHAPQEQ